MAKSLAQFKSDVLDHCPCDDHAKKRSFSLGGLQEALSVLDGVYAQVEPIVSRFAPAEYDAVLTIAGAILHAAAGANAAPAAPAAPAD